VVNVEDESMNVLASYDQHESLAYGVDWWREESDSLSLASCSFYDHLFTCWNIEGD